LLAIESDSCSDPEVFTCFQEPFFGVFVSSNLELLVNVFAVQNKIPSHLDSKFCGMLESTDQLDDLLLVFFVYLLAIIDSFIDLTYSLAKFVNSFSDLAVL